MSDVDTELEKLNIDAVKIEPMQEKDGIIVARIFTLKTHYVLKIFEKTDYLREIKAYELLQQLGIPTLTVIGETERALLLEDIGISPVYRLGRAEDMDDPQIASCLGKWYRHLHDRGKEYIAQYSPPLYEEADDFTVENVDFIRRKTQTENHEVWDFYIRHCETIRKMMASIPKTLTYNDFYSTNLIVARDKSSAMMFDFNMMGKGYAYGDVRNVCSSLSSRAGDAFLEAYGDYSRKEKNLDDVVSPVTALCIACRREVFPAWGQAVLKEALCDVEKKLARVLEDA